MDPLRKQVNSALFASNDVSIFLFEYRLLSRILIISMNASLAKKGYEIGLQLWGKVDGLEKRSNLHIFASRLIFPFFEDDIPVVFSF